MGTCLNHLVEAIKHTHNLCFEQKSEKIFSQLKKLQYRNGPMFSDTWVWAKKNNKTVQTQIRLVLEEQSDQGHYCLLFPLQHFDKIT